jgi:hypothetical protein
LCTVDFNYKGLHNELDKERKILPLFCKKGTTHKISVLQEKQGGGTVVHVTDAL